MSTRFEYYDTGGDGYAAVWLAAWKAQSFTPVLAHKITSVKLPLFRVGSPGTLTVSIKNTTSLHPSGGDLCAGTTSGNALTANTAGEWKEISLGNGCALSSTVMYAIVARALNADASNYVAWYMDVTAPAYTAGYYEQSTNSGGTWTTMARDFLFEEYGTVYPTDATTRVTGLVHRYSPGNYTLEVFLGDTKTDWDEIKPIVTDKPSVTLEKPASTTKETTQPNILPYRVGYRISYDSWDTQKRFPFYVKA